MWTAKSGIQDLDTLGGTTGWAFATNLKGQAVGYSTTSVEKSCDVVGAGRNGGSDLCPRAENTRRAAAGAPGCCR